MASCGELTEKASGGDVIGRIRRRLPVQAEGFFLRKPEGVSPVSWRNTLLK